MTEGFNRNHAMSLDRADPLSALRSQFDIPRDPDGHALAYFAGNSLGCMPIEARRIVSDVLEQWSAYGVRGHFDGSEPWYRFDEPIAANLAEVVGAKHHEVALMGSLTSNLHLLMASFYRPEGRRRKILIEPHAFPSDRYAVGSQVSWHGGDPGIDVVEIATAADDSLTVDDVIDSLDRHEGEVAMALLGGVNYYTGQLLDLESIAGLLRERGVVVGSDLAHAAGNVALAIHEWGVDFAAWCTYKYLNSGPGATAAVFVHERHGLDTGTPRLAGWWGNDPDVRFDMHSEAEFVPRPGAHGWKVSNPSVLAMAPVAVSAAMFAEVGMAALRERSMRLTAFLELGLSELEDATVITPSDREQRGAQLSVRVSVDPTNLEAEMAEQGAIVDARDPDVIRIAPAPMYNTFEDIVEVVECLDAALRNHALDPAAPDAGTE